jgi:hypothetical protein
MARLSRAPRRATRRGTAPPTAYAAAAERALCDRVAECSGSAKAPRHAAPFAAQPRHQDAHGGSGDSAVAAAPQRAQCVPRHAGPWGPCIHRRHAAAPRASDCARLAVRCGVRSRARVRARYFLPPCLLRDRTEASRCTSCRSVRPSAAACNLHTARATRSAARHHEQRVSARTGRRRTPQQRCGRAAAAQYRFGGGATEGERAPLLLDAAAAPHAAPFAEHGTCAHSAQRGAARQHRGACCRRSGERRAAQTGI